MTNENALLNWCVEQTKDYPVLVTNFTTSWKDGLAFCALIHKHAPDNIDFSVLKPEDALRNATLAFDIAEKKFNISPSLDPHTLVTVDVPDSQSIIEYISQLYVSLTGNTLDNMESISDLTQLRLSLLQIKSSDPCICGICGFPVYTFERLIVSNKEYHRGCFRTIQLNNLNERNNLSIHCTNGQTTSVSSSQSSSNSPSPVGMPIQSPFAANTIHKHYTLTELPKLKTPKKQAPPRPPLPKLDRGDHTETIPETNKVFMDNKSCDTDMGYDNSYPSALNPFDENYCGNIRLQAQTSINDKYKTPFDDDEDDEEEDEGDDRIGVHLFNDADVATSLSHTHSFPTFTSSFTSKTTTESSGETCTNAVSGASCDSPSIYHDASSINCPLSENLSRRSFNLSRCTQMITRETKSAIIKRPAPPIPVVIKRNIRTETTNEFMPYAELHKKLFLINQELSEIEANARALQNKIKKASVNGHSTKPLLDKWLQVVQQKDVIFQKESELLNKLRCQELDDRHTELEHELRVLLAKQDILKTKEEKLREEELLADLLCVVDKRAEIVDSIHTQSMHSKMSPKKRFKNKLKKITCLSNHWQLKNRELKLYPLFKFNKQRNRTLTLSCLKTSLI